jgi:hypothetical protein
MSLTQTNEVLIHLQQYGAITPLEALDKFGCFRLGARIYDLRKQGHDIETEYVTRGDKTFARYTMKRVEAA